jgi:23S rRNA (uracil1939-C5)-methyltransferase
VRLKIDSLAHGGFGLARRDGVVFVPFVIPGELVEAEIASRKRGTAFARLCRVMEPSPHRVEPPCPVFGVCGGCHWQHIAYPAQPGFKADILKESLRRMAKIHVDAVPVLSGEPWGYRRRANIKISEEGQVGFFGSGSHTVVETPRCLLLAEPLNAVTAALKERRDLLCGITEIEAACDDGGAALCLHGDGVTAGRAAALRGALPGVRGVISAEGDVWDGEAAVVFDVLGMRLRITAGNFFQANAALNRGMVAAALDMLGPLEGKAVLDAYAGAGNFTLPLARAAAHVTAVEGNPRAARDARENLAAHGLSNGHVFSGALEQARPAEPPYAALVDPPRTGLSRTAVDKLLELAPNKLLYVSCDPATLARDLGLLRRAYELKQIRLADLFPQTYHLEALALLERTA